jgi:hypothetical protein
MASPSPGQLMTGIIQELHYEMKEFMEKIGVTLNSLTTLSKQYNGQVT